MSVTRTDIVNEARRCLLERSNGSVASVIIATLYLKGLFDDGILAEAAQAEIEIAQSSAHAGAM